MKGEAIILGCGSSAGVPMIGGNWGKCDPANPQNKRTRTSLAIQTEKANLIIDTGPDFKEQYNRENLDVPDAFFYTHAHDDHIMGVNEIRWLVGLGSKPLPIYSNQDTIEEIERRFHYLFHPPRPDLYQKSLVSHAWMDEHYFSEHDINGLKFSIFPIDHESVTCVGFRFGDFAYTTDCIRIDDTVLQKLNGVKTWVVDAAGFYNKNNPSHASVDDVVKWNDIVQADQVYFTVLGPHMDYDVVMKETPEGYAPAYDGLRIGFNV